MSGRTQHICLIGGGHAHVAVLADWIETGVPAERATLITPYPTLRYSGMVPGWISGQYQRDEGLVDLVALAARAQIELVLDRCVGIDPLGRSITIAAGGSVAFDLASIDTGGVGRAESVLGNDERMVDIRPIDRFVDRFKGLAERAPSARIAVVGGGAGGVELAFAMQNMLPKNPHREVVLVAGDEGLLPDHSGAVQRLAMRELRRQDIAVIERNASLADGMLKAGEQSLEPVGLMVAALGSGAPDWPGASGLACDEAGFIAVDAYQRSTSHPHIFAVGDVAARQDMKVPHSGVHAVFAGPILADNLRAAANQRPPVRSYIPRANHLYLLSTGDGSAIASYGPFSAVGRWVARLKHWIDTRWIRKYARLGGTV